MRTIRKFEEKTNMAKSTIARLESKKESQQIIKSELTREKTERTMRKAEERKTMSIYQQHREQTKTQ